MVPNGADVRRPFRGGTPWRVGALAERVGADFDGDAAVEVDHVAPLQGAGSGALVFISDRRMRQALHETGAAAVILRPEDREQTALPALVTANPQLAFARAARLIHPEPRPDEGVHASAWVAASAVLGAGAAVGPRAVVEEGARLGARVWVQSGAVVQAAAEIGDDTVIESGAVIGWGCRLGRRCRVEPGAVIGGTGFGFAQDGGSWVRIPQLGRVLLGDDVEIGANAAIDRATLGETVLEDGVKIDNLVHIAHNCRIGAHSAIAGQVGLAGSTRIGPGCTVGGQAGFADHLEIAGGCHFTGRAMVTASIDEPGVYSSGLPATPNRRWRKSVARVQQLDEMARRIQALEREIEALRGGARGDLTEDGE